MITVRLKADTTYGITPQRRAKYEINAPAPFERLSRKSAGADGLESARCL
jgi:hypothetical protein